MLHLDIRNRNLDQGVPWMAELSARLAFTLHPLTARATVQSITGGGLAAVVAILGKSLLQVSYALGKASYLLLGSG
jgi:hypothetical protein